MVTLIKLEESGYPPSFFNFRPNQAASFAYYTFSTRPKQYATSWDIVGLHARSESGWPLDVQLLHIEEDLLEQGDDGEEAFEAPRDAQGFFWMDVAECAALLLFFETRSAREVAQAENGMRHFQRMSRDDLARIHLHPWLLQREAGHYYRYVPENSIQGEETLSVVCFPRWESQTASLEFETFPLQRLQDSTFRPFETAWGGYMTFTQESWQEFLSLLKQYTYENAS